MDIPYAIIEPFGWTDIPTILMVRQGEDPALLARIFRACELSKKDAIERWELIQRCIETGIRLSKMELDEVFLQLRAELAGGRDVECTVHSITIHDEEVGFYMSINFHVPGDSTHYGSFLEYPNGEDS